MITENKVNCYEGADLHCQSKGTLVRSNVGHEGQPDQSGESAGTVAQSFEAERTERLTLEQI